MLWTPTSSRWQQTQLKTIPSQRVIEWELHHTQSGFCDHALLHGRFLRRRIWLKNNYLEAQIIFAPAKTKYEFRCLYLSNTWLALTSKDPTEDLRNCYIIFISYVATIYFYPAVSLKTADRCNLKTVFWKKAEINMTTDLPFDFSLCNSSLRRVHYSNKNDICTLPKTCFLFDMSADAFWTVIYTSLLKTEFLMYINQVSMNNGIINLQKSILRVPT